MKHFEELELKNGVRVAVRALYWEGTYAGLLEGYPMARINRTILGNVSLNCGQSLPGL